MIHSPNLRGGVLAVLLIFATGGGTSFAHENRSDGDAAKVMRVVEVVPDGPAAASGLRKGDRILDWDGKVLRTQSELDSFLSSRRAGDVVPLLIDRGGESLSIDLTLGEGGHAGKPRLGISLGVEASPEAPGEDKIDADECRSWIRDTYRVGELAVELNLDLDEWHTDNQTCVDRDLGLMAPEIPRGWCDNVFKIHCSGLDLLAEIGETLVERCEGELNDALGRDVTQDREWNTCAESTVFDGYSMRGEVPTLSTCRQALDDCRGEQPVAQE